MSDLISAIENLNTRDLFDYFSTFLPLVLSIVAIVIAIVTSNKQSNIALFDKRYVNYKKLLDFISQWKISIIKYYELLGDKRDIDIKEFRKFILQISLMKNDEVDMGAIKEYYSGKNLDQDKIRYALLQIKYRDSNTLDETSLLYKSISNDVEIFHKQFCCFFEQLDKVFLDEMSHADFQENIDDFQKKFASFHNLFYKKIIPKIKIRD